MATADEKEAGEGGNRAAAGRELRTHLHTVPHAPSCLPQQPLLISRDGTELGGGSRAENQLLALHFGPSP